MNRFLAVASLALPFSLLSGAPAPGASGGALSLTGRGAPFVILDDATPAAAASPFGAEVSSGAPRALAAGDLDGDGMPDLAVALESGGRGRIVVYPGNVDHLFPNEPEAQLRRGSGEGFAEAFLPARAVVELERAPDFLAVGDVDADGRADLIAATLGASAITIAAGDGHGGYAAAREIALDGAITAFAAGEIDQRDRLLDLAVAVAAGDRAGLRIFAGPQGAANAVAERVALVAPARALALDKIDADALPDLAAATAAGIELHFGVARVPDGNGADRDRAVRTIGVAALALATGDFSADAGSFRRELAWVDEAGDLGVARIDRDAAGRLAVHPTARVTAVADGGETALLPANLNSAGREQLVVVGGGGAPRIVQPELPAAQRAAGFGRLDLDGAPAIAAIALRLNRDPLADLVVLAAGDAEPRVLESAPETIYTVNVEGNNVDCNGGDNVCSTDGGSGCGSGGCTLRAAIQQANAHAGADAIDFAIGASGSTHVIDTNGEGIAETVTIDGTTQPGYAGAPLIHVEYWAGAAFNCQGSSYTVRGFGVTGPGSGVYLAAGTTNSFIEGSRFGPALAQPALSSPVVTFVGASSTGTVGGATVAARNIFFGDSANYTDIRGVDHVLRGNWFGLNAAGVFDSSNNTSVVLYDTSGVDFLGNVVAGAASASSQRKALNISGGSGAVVQGNFFGTDATGNADSGGLGDGVVFEPSGSSEVANLTFGGSAAGQGNVVAGFPLDGVRFTTAQTGNVVRGNRIGIGADGTTALGNGLVGLRLGYGSAASITVGGTGAGEGNTIANSGAAGVQVQDGWNHRIRGNSIFDNFGLGIDLTSQGNGTGVSANDVGDGDGGDWSGHGNKYQNFPVLAAAGGTKVAGGLNSVASQTFDLDFYSSPSCDSSGHGEAKAYLGSLQVSTNAAGCAPFSAAITAVTNGAAVTATATDSAGNTSEISACWTADSTALFLDGFESGLLCGWSVVAP